jgi:hypothetical protein
MWFTFRYTIPGSYTAIRLGSGQASIRGGASEGRIFPSVSDSGSDRFLGTGGAGITGDMNGDAEESSTEAVRTRFIATRSTIGMHIFMETTAEARLSAEEIAGCADMEILEDAQSPQVVASVEAGQALLVESAVAATRAAFLRGDKQASAEGAGCTAEAGTEAVVAVNRGDRFTAKRPKPPVRR